MIAYLRSITNDLQLDVSASLSKDVNGACGRR